MGREGSAVQDKVSRIQFSSWGCHVCNLLLCEKLCQLGVFVCSLHINKFSMCKHKQSSSKTTKQSKNKEICQNNSNSYLNWLPNKTRHKLLLKIKMWVYYYKYNYFDLALFASENMKLLISIILLPQIIHTYNIRFIKFWENCEKTDIEMVYFRGPKRGSRAYRG